jgi:uncharacterized membrane protein YkvA (DUF1232 family)
MLRDYWLSAYPDVSWWVITVIVFALLYVFSSIDLIPDFLPGIGLLDDALVIAILSDAYRKGSVEISGMERVRKEFMRR